MVECVFGVMVAVVCWWGLARGVQVPALDCGPRVLVMEYGAGLACMPFMLLMLGDVAQVWYVPLDIACLCFDPGAPIGCTVRVDVGPAESPGCSLAITPGCSPAFVLAGPGFLTITRMTPQNCC